MTKRVSIRDVSQLAGVSVSCASLVFTGRNGKIPLAKETIEKVLKAAEELQYRPNRQARNLRSGTAQNGVIGLLISDSAAAGELNRRVLTGVCRAASLRNYECLLAVLSEDKAASLTKASCVANKQIDGIVAVGFESLELHSLEAMLGSRVPVTAVHIATPCRNQLFSSVQSDDYTGGRLAAQCLIDAGHRRLGFIGGAPAGDAAQARIAGFRAKAEEAGLPEPAVLTGDYRSVDLTALKRLLLAEAPPTGLAACSDLIAAQLLWQLPQWGLAVPEQISVVGYDDDNMSAFLRPALTTIRQDGFAEGKIAVDLLVSLIEQQAVAERFITLAPELIIRSSVAKIN